MPPFGLVLASIASVQFGAALAATLFDELGPVGTTLLRTAFAGVILVALWRPRLRGHDSRDLALAGLFGLVLAAMNTCFYLSIDRIPLGLAVTLEFVGPLGLVIVMSRRARTPSGSCSPAPASSCSRGSAGSSILSASPWR